MGGNVITNVTVNGYAGFNLAAYDFRINFDKTKVNITAVAGGDGSFSGAPVYTSISSANSTGQLSINSFSAGGQPGPTIRVAAITWRGVDLPGSALALTIMTLSDVQGNDLIGVAAVNGSITVWQTPAASFTKSSSSVVAGTAIQFTDTSSGSPLAWSWNFGDGTGSSLQNPSKTYNTAGNYTVTLQVTNPAGASTSAGQTVSVYAMPAASFTKSASSGAIPLTVLFNDTSTGNITTWSWDFGDGTGSSLQNPSKTYDIAGNYTVTLQVTNPAGASTSAGQTVTVYAMPAASFTKSSSNVVAGTAIQFTDTSSGSPLAWSWNFGDGTGSSLQNPSKTYNTAGNYTVTLQVTNPAGTSTSAGQTVSVYATPGASFTKSASSGAVPLTVAFNDTSTGNVTTWSWDFGDGTGSSLPNPSKTYNTAGNYTVTLQVTNPAGASTSAGQTVSVYGTPAASFTKSASSGVAPLTVTFSDTSTGNVTAWSWDFGDGTGSSLQNPSKTYNTAGNYTVTLQVTNPAGASTSAGQTVSVYATPAASFIASPTNTRQGVPVSFTDTSTGNIASWLWNFGDGTTSSTQNPTRSYTADGNYTVSLTVTNPAGADTMTKSGYITILSYKAETAMTVGLDPNAYIGGKVNRFFNPATGDTVSFADGIASFDAYLTYDAAGMNIRNAAGMGAFTTLTTNYNTDGGARTTVAASQPGTTAQPPLELFRLYPHLTGSKDNAYSVTLHFNTVRPVGSGDLPQQADVTRTFRRGDANGNGAVNVVDNLFIVQYLAGLRGLGETSYLVNPVNAATARNDSSTDGARIGITDALYIAQMLVGLRDAAYNMI